jgi:hypothetical protein
MLTVNGEEEEEEEKDDTGGNDKNDEDDSSCKLSKSFSSKTVDSGGAAGVIVECILVPRTIRYRKWIRSLCLVICFASLEKCVATAGRPFAHAIWTILYTNLQNNIVNPTTTKMPPTFRPSAMQIITAQIMAATAQPQMLLPPRGLPSVGPLLGVILSLLIHVLVTILLPQWFVPFRVWLDYQRLPISTEASNEEEVERTTAGGSSRKHRTSYVLVRPQEEENGEEEIDDNTNYKKIKKGSGVVTKVSSPSLSWSSLKGLEICRLHPSVTHQLPGRWTSSKSSAATIRSSSSVPPTSNHVDDIDDCENSDQHHSKNPLLRRIMESQFSHPYPSYFEWKQCRIYLDMTSGTCIQGGPTFHRARLLDLYHWSSMRLVHNKINNNDDYDFNNYYDVARQRYGPYNRYATHEQVLLPTLAQAIGTRLASPLVVVQMIGRLVSILEEGWTNTLVNLAETVLRHVYNARQAIASAKELALEIQTSVQDASSRLVWVLREDGFDDDNDNTVNQVTSKTTTTTNHTTTESRPRNKIKQKRHKKKATKQQRPQWIQTEAVNLLPGDIFIMNLEQQQKQQHNHPGGGAGSSSSSSSLVIPVDALVLKGECLTNEAVLTGESVPQSKVPMDFLDYIDSNDTTTRNVASLDQEGGKESGAVSDLSVQSSSSSSSSLTKATCLDLQHHRQSILFAGTTMVHCSSTTYPSEDDGPEQEKDEDEENDTPRKKKQNEIGTNVNGVMCLALRTGTYSSKGELLRTLQRNSHVGAISNPQSERDAIRLIGSLSVVAALSCLSLFLPLQKEKTTIAMPTTAGSTKMSHVTNGHERSHQLRPVSGFRRVIQSTRIIVSTIPSDLPLSLSAVARTCAYQLRKEADVVCSEPGSLLTAAHVDMVVFDKVRRGGGRGGDWSRTLSV